MKTHPVKYIKVNNSGLSHSDNWLMDRYVVAWCNIYPTLTEVKYNVIDRVLMIRI